MSEKKSERNDFGEYLKAKIAAKSREFLKTLIWALILLFLIGLLVFVGYSKLQGTELWMELNKLIGW